MIVRIPIGLFLTACGLPVCAQPVLPTTGAVSLPTAYAAVKVDGRRVFDISGNAGLSSAECAVPINHRLEHLIERTTDIPPFSAKDLISSDGETMVTLGGERILTVTEEDAKEELTNRDELALTWGEKLSEAVVLARSARANPFKGVGLLISNSSEDMVLSGIKWLPRLVGAVLVWTLFWFLARLVRLITRQMTQSERLDSNIRQLIRAMSFYGTWIVGGIIMLSTLGLDSSSIAAGLGSKIAHPLSHQFTTIRLFERRKRVHEPSQGCVQRGRHLPAVWHANYSDR